MHPGPCVSAPPPAPPAAPPRLRLQVSVTRSPDGNGYVGYVHRKKTSWRTWLYVVFAFDQRTAKVKAETWMESRLAMEGGVQR